MAGLCRDNVGTTNKTIIHQYIFNFLLFIGNNCVLRRLKTTAVNIVFFRYKHHQKINPTLKLMEKNESLLLGLPLISFTLVV
jgi:hypothetical protein